MNFPFLLWCFSLEYSWSCGVKIYFLRPLQCGSLVWLDGNFDSVMHVPYFLQFGMYGMLWGKRFINCLCILRPTRLHSSVTLNGSAVCRFVCSFQRSFQQSICTIRCLPSFSLSDGDALNRHDAMP
ncbi:hypothetical protein, unlikely [Trypanosoma congolense IL3000]|uniref:Uncharacterized protein n=1 Tax=Trypanosoma congolense (strain IL3000) TaxID=1068625 RepID=F9W393_TRYCI|nr:hypothetical protein, unlikely [Trypanosoma congolense IL3000]